MSSPTHGPAQDRPSQAEPAGSNTGHATHGATAALTLGAVGVVFGDIGTSPLYAFTECVHGPHAVEPTRDNVLGILSLMAWSLIMVVTVKYLLVLMRADNRGEGGIMALLALVPENLRGVGQKYAWVVPFVLAGSALLYGDGILTPAISVLSAVEGLQTVAPRLSDAVVPATCVILVGLFAIQRRGTGSIGTYFGPIMVVWFVTLGGLGIVQILQNPSVLAGFSPLHAVRYFAHHGWHGMSVLGSVVLVITGGEALYADMGHFGRKPIQYAWLSLVFPALLLNYFGQGALVLRDPSAASRPFYGMVSQGWPALLLVGIAVPATVIASQALISGVFSLTRQAVQLGFFPRVEVRHTSHDSEGQVYLPTINALLAFGCLTLVLIYGSSSRLAAAYGLAVSGTMTITSVVFYVVLVATWRWSPVRALGILLLFLSFDVPFLIANGAKFTAGGYIPVVVGSLFFVVMYAWRMGRRYLGAYFARRAVPLQQFLDTLDQNTIGRIPGTAVFMASSSDGTPPTLLQQVRANRVVHESAVLLTIITAHRPRVDPTERYRVKALGHGVYRLMADYGFMERATVPELLQTVAADGAIPLDPAAVTYYIGRETIVSGGHGSMPRWAEEIFSFLARNAQRATRYFGIPTEQVVELGAEIDL